MDAPLDDSQLVYEPKYDGIRAIVEIAGPDVRLWSRLGNEKTHQFPEIAAALQRWGRKHKQPVLWGSPAQRDDDVSGAGAYTHMTLLAETTEGMHNLFTLSSLASLEGYFRKPRMDRELLARYAQGLIATTGCAGGAGPNIMCSRCAGTFYSGARAHRGRSRHGTCRPFVPSARSRIAAVARASPNAISTR